MAEPELVAGPRVEEEVFAPLPGPADRVSFFAEQARRRRQTWRLTAACAVVAILAGLPLSLAITPVFYAVVLLLLKLVSLFLPLPEFVWDGVRSVTNVIDAMMVWVDESSNVRPGAADIAALVAVWLLPGVVVMLLLWPATYAVFRRAGIGAMLLGMGARPPRIDDLEERQLVNIAEEAAIAAGLPPPRVMVIDAPTVNAGAVGSSPRDATIIVTRRLLDTLDRDETQGVIAHLAGSTGNGDLSVALRIVAVHQAFGLALSFLLLPMSSDARADVRRFLRVVFGMGREDEVQYVAHMLTHVAGRQEEKLDFDSAEQYEQVRERPGPSVKMLVYLPPLYIAGILVTAILGWEIATLNMLMVLPLAGAGALLWYQREYVVARVRWGIIVGRFMLMLPYYMAVMMPRLMLTMFGSFILDPWLARLWRTRRFLADASAVQLTRNPDGLARALADMVRTGGLFPGGAWAAPLFIVGGNTVASRVQAERVEGLRRSMDEEMAAIRGDGAPATGAGGLIVEARAYKRLLSKGAGAENVRIAIAQAEEASQGAPAGGALFGSSGIGSYHPGLDQRLDRLRRLGATVRATGKPRGWRMFGHAMPVSTAFGGLLTLLMVPLMALAGVLMVVAFVLMGALSLGASLILMLVVYGLAQWVLPG